MDEMRETKLLFREAALADALGAVLLGLRAAAGFPCAKSGEEFLDDTYWAAPGGEESREVVRHRRFPDGRGVWQRKHPVPRRGNDLRHRVVSRRGAPEGPPPFSREKGTPRPVLRVFTHRRLLTVSCPGEPLTVALDASTYRDPDGRVIGAGMEVECRAPASCAAFDTVAAWLRANLSLVPASRSKLARGLAMLRGGAGIRRVILDCDPGVDDAIALLLAMASPELDLRAVTTVAGNAPLGQTTRNAAFVLRRAAEFYGRPVPALAAGATPPGPLPDARDVHGPDGLGGVMRACPPGCPPTADDVSAADLMASVLRSHPAGSVTLLATGPLTNLAALAERHPLAFRRAAGVVAMGGSFFSPGNRARAAEFNIHRDPPSADAVVKFCRSGADDGAGPVIPLTFVGLDVTHQVRLFRDDLRHCRRGPGAFVKKISRLYMDFYERNEGLPGCYLHDPLAVALVIDPSLCETEPFHVDIETAGEHTAGAAIADDRPSRLYANEALRVTNVCVTVDAPRARDLILGRVIAPRP